jgi:hypothetical protein
LRTGGADHARTAHHGELNRGAADASGGALRSDSRLAWPLTAGARLLPPFHRKTPGRDWTGTLVRSLVNAHRAGCGTAAVAILVGAALMVKRLDGGRRSAPAAPPAASKPKMNPADVGGIRITG